MSPRWPPIESTRQGWIARVCILALATLANAAAHASPLQLRTVASGLAQPTFATAPPDDPTRLFVVEQPGTIRILDLQTETLHATPFLDLTGLVAFGFGEQGLLGLAFHPDYASNGLFFVAFTQAIGGTTVVARYQVSANPGVAQSGSGRIVIAIAQPQANHNGGWIGFGPDGHLYVSTGDGGGGNDQGAGHTEPGGNAQDIEDNWLGKILRLDVDGDDFPADPNRNYAIPPDNPFVGAPGDDEIWAYGLRNPWRASFDRMTGDLWIGDVGQLAREEIDLQPASSAGGENYGWRLREGTIATPTGSPVVGGARPPGSVDPVYDYARPASGAAVVGGYVYRGPLAWLQGSYFFSDSRTRRVESLRFDGSDPADFDGTNHLGITTWTDDPGFLPGEGTTLHSPSSFGEDAAGNLYLVDHGPFFPAEGRVFLVPEPAPAALAAAALATVALIARQFAGARAPGRS